MGGSPMMWPDVRHRPVLDLSRWSGVRRSGWGMVFPHGCRSRLMRRIRHGDRARRAGALCVSVLVQVDQVAEAVGNDGVDASVVRACGFLDEDHAEGFEPFGVASAVL